MRGVGWGGAYRNTHLDTSTESTPHTTDSGLEILPPARERVRAKCVRHRAAVIHWQVWAPVLRNGCLAGKADSTLRSAQAVPHPSTNRALCRLTSEVGRDPVHSTWYGRQQWES